MDAQLKRRLSVAAAIVAAAGLGAVGLVQAQQPAPASPSPGISVSPAAPPTIEAPPDESAPAPEEATTPEVADRPAVEAKRPDPVAAVTSGGQPVVEKDAAPPPPTVGPVRSPTAVIQALDKVTAETMRFAAPVGKRVRYKNLVFTVRACETKGLGDPQPQSAAYVIVESAPLNVAGRAPVKQVFKGWMYATSPGLNPLQHPVYDAWLIACSAAPA